MGRDGRPDTVDDNEGKNLHKNSMSGILRTGGSQSYYQINLSRGLTPLSFRTTTNKALIPGTVYSLP